MHYSLDAASMRGAPDFERPAAFRILAQHLASRSFFCLSRHDLRARIRGTGFKGFGFLVLFKLKLMLSGHLEFIVGRMWLHGSYVALNSAICHTTTYPIFANVPLCLLLECRVAFDLPHILVLAGNKFERSLALVPSNGNRSICQARARKRCHCVASAVSADDKKRVIIFSNSTAATGFP